VVIKSDDLLSAAESRSWGRKFHYGNKTSGVLRHSNKIVIFPVCEAKTFNGEIMNRILFISK
jgi:hypothetical protein